MKQHVISSSNSQISGVPLRTLVYRHSLDFDLYCAVTGVLIKKGNENETFFGHSVSNNIEKATIASKYEALERVFCSKHMLKQEKYLSYDFWDKEKETFINKDNISLRGINDIGATGLSCHVNIECAKLHSVSEILERHILSSTWYGSMKLLPIFKDQSVGNNMYLSSYTTEIYSNYCISIIRNRDSSIFFSGSSISNSLVNSMRKSKHEAFMLINNHLEGMMENKHYNMSNRASSLINIKRLVGKEARLINEHFEMNVISNIKPIKIKYISLQEQLRNFGFSLHDISYVIIHKEKEMCVVKSFLHGSLSKESGRKKRKGALHDPYC